MNKIILAAVLILLAGVKLGDWMMPSPETSTAREAPPRAVVKPPVTVNASARVEEAPTPGARATGSDTPEVVMDEAPGASATSLWLITNSGIAVSPRRALPGHTIALLYSSWCPAVRSSLSKFLDIIRPATRGRHIVGLFANDELSQLLDLPEWLESEGISSTEQAMLRRKIATHGIGTGLVANEYAYPVDQPYPRLRVPRAQWEALGGKPGALHLACFHDGVRESCPEGLDQL